MVPDTIDFKDTLRRPSAASSSRANRMHHATLVQDQARKRALELVAEQKKREQLLKDQSQKLNLEFYS